VTAPLLVVDGYNAIHALPELRARLDHSLEHARDGLMKIAREWRARHAAWEVVIVYDGQTGVMSPESAKGGGGVRAVFTPSRQEADDRIKKMIRQKERGAEMVVLTRDREILGCGRDHGVRGENPEFLVRRSEPKSKKAAAAGPKKDTAAKDRKEVTDWYREALRAKGKI